MSIYLFLKFYLSWFACIVLPTTKVRYAFNKNWFCFIGLLTNVMEVKLPVYFIVFFCYHHSITVTSQTILWFIRTPGVLVSRLSIWCLWYSWWFDRMSTLLLLNLCLSLFSCSVLTITKLIGNFKTTNFDLLSCCLAWRRPYYQCNFSVSRYLSSQRNCNNSV